MIKVLHSSFVALLLFVLVLLLCSCSGVVRNSGFEPETRTGLYQYTDDLENSVVLHDMPKVSLSTHCLEDAMLSFGPWIALPLPIIPNPQYLLDRNEYKKNSGQLRLEIIAPPGYLSWKTVTVDLSLDGKSLEPSKMEDVTNQWNQQRYYIFEPEISCEKLENKKIVVSVTGTPELLVENPVTYKHRWYLWSEGP